MRYLVESTWVSRALAPSLGRGGPATTVARRSWVALSVTLGLGVGCGPTPNRSGPDVQAQAVSNQTQSVVTDIPTQDGVCSVAGLDTNENPCFTACCDDHDRCYAHNGCRASSWLAGPADPDCSPCNETVVACLWGCMEERGSHAHTAAGGDGRCRSTRDCPSGKVCSDANGDGQGQCTQPYSRGTLAVCNAPVDCQSALCVQGRCAPPGPFKL